EREPPEKAWSVERSESQKTCRPSPRSRNTGRARVVRDRAHSTKAARTPPFAKGPPMIASRSWLRRSFWFCLALFAASLLAAPSARADAFSTYQPEGTFSLPGASALFDVPSDGRVVALVGSTVYRETAAGSRSFSSVGPLPPGDIPSFGC